jgi:uncharacterized protein YegL
MIQQLFALYAVIAGVQRAIPLQTIHIQGEVNTGVARIHMIQTFKNTEAVPIDTSYKFPILDNLVFDSFEASYHGKTIKGQVKGKKAAAEEYKAEAEQGSIVSHVEALENNEDVMKISLANIPSGEEVTVKISFLTPLESVYGGRWQLKIPATLTPRYKLRDDPTVEEVSAFDSYTTLEKPYEWNIEVKVTWPHIFQRVSSPSHPTQLEIVPVAPFTILAKLGGRQSHVPNKDFLLEIEDQELFREQVEVAQTPKTSVLPEYSAVLQFAPEMNMAKAKRDKQISAENLKATQAEYIFILDRSGSMMGDRIEDAKKSLILFLKSLPQNSYFNIISFGSSFYGYPEALKYNDQNVEKAVNEISAMGADLGGTEILEPIRHALNLPKMSGFQRNIYLLTDGAVSNSEAVVSQARTMTANNQARIFSIGIGNGCSEKFIKQIAEQGRGKSLLLVDKDPEMQSKIIGLLQESLSPALSDFEIVFDKNYVKGIAPLLDSNSHVLRNEPFRLYLLLDESLEGKSTHITVNYWDSLKAARISKTFTVTLKNPLKTDVFQKLFLKHIFDRKPSYFALQDLDGDQDKFLEQLSVNTQVLAKDLTAFIYVVKKGSGDRGDVEEVIVPSVLPVDYSGQQQVHYTMHARSASAGAYAHPSAQANVAYGAPPPNGGYRREMKKSARMGGGAMQDSYAPQMDASQRVLEVAEMEMDSGVEATGDGGSGAEEARSKESWPAQLVKELTDTMQIEGRWVFSMALFERLQLKMSFVELQRETGIWDQDNMLNALITALLRKLAETDRSLAMIANKCEISLLAHGIGEKLSDKIDSMNLFN